MAGTKQELILQNLKTTLEAITAGDDYDATVNLVQRKSTVIQSLPTGDVPALFIIAGMEELQHDAGERIRAEFKIGIVGFIRASGEPGAQCLALIGDVKKAVETEWTRGGNASNTMVLWSDNLGVSQEPLEGFEMEIQVLYHYDTTSP